MQINHRWWRDTESEANEKDASADVRLGISERIKVILVYMALLQIMKHDSDEVQGEVIHVVDEVHHGAEYTACGLATPDSRLDFEGYEHVGEPFRGSLKKCTCSACLKTINYYKSLR